MVVRPEDSKLGEELAGVGEVPIFGCLDQPDQWALIVARLRTMGYVVQKPAGPDFGAAYARCEPRIQEVLSRRAPPGTEVTPVLIHEVQAEIARILVGEIQRLGVGEQAANVIGAMMTAAINVKEKAT